MFPCPDCSFSSPNKRRFWKSKIQKVFLLLPADGLNYHYCLITNFQNFMHTLCRSPRKAMKGPKTKFCVNCMKSIQHISGKLIGVSRRYVHSFVGIVIVVSLPRRIYYDTFAMFISFPKICAAMHVPKFMKMNQVSKIIFRTSTLPFLQEWEKKPIGSPCHKFQKLFQPLTLTSKFWSWTSNKRMLIRCFLSWKIVQILPLSLIGKYLTKAYRVLVFVFKLNCQNPWMRIQFPLIFVHA